MAKIKTTMLVEEDLLRRVRVKAARTGRRQSDVLDEALRQGLDPSDRIQTKVALPEDQANELAAEAVKETREARRNQKQRLRTRKGAH